LYTVKSPYILRKLFKSLIHWDVKTTEKTLYLSFDDGPIPEVTPKVVELLKVYDAKATFFMVGENIDKYNSIFQEVKAAGHTIGNHTYNHIKSWKSTNKEYFDNIDKASELIDGKLFRPPHGQIKLKQLKDLSKDYNIVFWSVLSGDFDNSISKEQCKDNVISNAKNGSIIVFHDSLKAEKNMLYALEKTLIHFSNLGYNFKSLAHLA